jgi:chemotaxis protein CheD
MNVQLKVWTGPRPTQLELRELERKAATVMPGEVRIDAIGAISTLLGSCIAVVLYDPERKLIGMNHFLLPHLRTPSAQPQTNLSGQASMEQLVNTMLHAGAAKHRLLAKAFGGAALLSVSSRISPGVANIRFTRAWLAAERIPLVAHDFGGQAPRKVVADPRTGEVHCRYISVDPTPLLKLHREELAYRRRLEASLQKTQIDFF